MFLFHCLLSSDFCYDLDIWTQGQALEVFLSLKCVYYYFVKSMKGVKDLNFLYCQTGHLTSKV